MSRISLRLSHKIVLILYKLTFILIILCASFIACSQTTNNSNKLTQDFESSKLDIVNPINPELVDITGWINSSPFTIEDMKGKVVLVDFFTYTCINCIRTYPYLIHWHNKYKDYGLVVLGVHAYEFEFEKDIENVRKAIKRHGLEYPIAMDNKRGTWNAFDNFAWPAKYLIDKNGHTQYSHYGEGEYLETEEKIRELLISAGFDLSGVNIEEINIPSYQDELFEPISNNSELELTRELYTGVDRNYGSIQYMGIPPYIVQSEYFQGSNKDVLYEDRDFHVNHFVYLHGLWNNHQEYIKHARHTERLDDYIAIKFSATSVNAVMGQLGERNYKVYITMDGLPLNSTNAGFDIEFDEKNNSYVLVNESKMYQLINLQSLESHELKLSSNSVEFSLFAFTFGSERFSP